MYSRMTGPTAARPSPWRESGPPGALELKVVPLSVDIYDFTEQNRTTVAELRHEMPELMPRIGKGDGLRAGCDRVSGKNGETRRASKVRGVDTQSLRKGIIQAQQLRRGDLCRCNALVERIRQPRISVVERDLRRGLRRSGGREI